MKTIMLISSLLLSTYAQAYGEAGRWSKGWAQGTSEYAAVVDDNNQLYIACSDMKPVSMTATVAGQEYGSSSGKSFAILVDGSRFDAPYDTDSRVGENNFFEMWDKLRQAKSVTLETPDGKQLALPTTDASSVLPASKSQQFGCLMGTESTEASTEEPTAAPVSPAETSAPLQPNELTVVSQKVASYNIPILVVTSRTENLNITDIVLNRGNCKVNSKDAGVTKNDIPLPTSLPFGSTAKFFILPFDCQVLEATIVTARGAVTFTFE
jgi:hypothetical protein